MYPKHFLDYFREFETTDEVFVAMPFGEEAAERRWEEIFVPAIEAVDLEPYRIDTREVSDSILTDILDGIGRARLVLGDVSGQGVTDLDDDRVRRPNPNAVYELGIAHAARLETEVVVVREEPEDDEEERVPFDLLHIRHHTFDPSDPEGAVETVASLLEDARNEINRTRDLIVAQTLNRLDEEAMDFVVDHYQRGWFDPWIDGEGEGDPRKEQQEVIRRLLDLGIVRAGRPHRVGVTRYYFTELGKTVATALPEPGGFAR